MACVFLPRDDSSPKSRYLICEFWVVIGSHITPRNIYEVLDSDAATGFYFRDVERTAWMFSDAKTAVFIKLRFG